MEALAVWALIELIGVAATPIAARCFARLPGSGAGFGHILGLLLVCWLVWLAGSIGLGLDAAVAVALVCGLGVALALLGSRATARSDEATAAADQRALRTGIFWGSHIAFTVAFAAMALLVSYSPDVWGTEKPMDMAFLAALDNAATFPPGDPWLAGEKLNYYYVGQLALALPVGLVGEVDDRGYNIALALLFGLAAAAIFCSCATIWASVRGRRSALTAGVLGIILALIVGNFEGLRELFAAGGYDWFSPSRVDPEMITEFPWFSFLLGDVHAHLIAIPFSLLALGFSLQLVARGPNLGALAELSIAALALGALYAINSWSYPVMVGLFVLAALGAPGNRLIALCWTLVAIVVSYLLWIWFWQNFDPAARGIAALPEATPVGAWVRDALLASGPPLAFVAVGYVVWATRLRDRAVICAGLLVLGGLLAMFFASALALVTAFAILALLALISSPPSERPVWLVIAGGSFCILGPEVAYIRDAFDASELYRMNTVFKLGYQAWLLLALGAVGALALLSGVRRSAIRWLVAIPLTAITIAGFAYPLAGTNARTDGFQRAPSLDGLSWLRASAPGDIGAIAWLRENAPADAVVLEATGPDYSPDGYGRISTFSGRPTVLGWAGHERQWGNDVGSRADDIARIYGGDVSLLGRYGVDYVVVGPLERADYGAVDFDAVGERVYDAQGTLIWKLDAR